MRGKWKRLSKVWKDWVRVKITANCNCKRGKEWWRKLLASLRPHIPSEWRSRPDQQISLVWRETFTPTMSALLSEITVLNSARCYRRWPACTRTHAEAEITNDELVEWVSKDSPLEMNGTERNSAVPSAYQREKFPAVGFHFKIFARGFTNIIILFYFFKFLIV